MYSISLLYKTLHRIRPSPSKGLSTWGRFKGKLRQVFCETRGWRGHQLCVTQVVSTAKWASTRIAVIGFCGEVGIGEREAVARDAFGHRKMKRNFFSAFFRLEIFPRGCKNWNSLLLQLGKSEKIKYSSARGVELFHRNKCTRTFEDYLGDTKNKCFYYSNIFIF